MTQNNKQNAARHINRRVLTLAAVVALMLALSAAAYAVVPGIFGWGGNFEIRQNETGVESMVYTDSLTEPVRFEDERMIFIVNDEEIDITELTSEEEPFHYEYTDAEGIIHYWIIGKNGPELENYGYAEFLYKPGESWIGGYSARTDIGPNGEVELWLENGKDTLDIPW